MKKQTDIMKIVMNSNIDPDAKADVILALAVKKQADELAKLHGCTAQEYLGYALSKTRESL